ncbi:BnaC09g28850D, partial [Brassica napus]
ICAKGVIVRGVGSIASRKVKKIWTLANWSSFVLSLSYFVSDVGRKRINNYFNLRWIEVVKTALSDAQQKLLAESQFRQLILMGEVNSIWYWRLRISYRSQLWDSANTVAGRTALGQKDKYKDEDTRLRLSLLLLVEGIICPTSGLTPIRPEVVEMVSNIGLLGRQDNWHKTHWQYKGFRMLWFYVKINVVTVQNLELIGQATVCSILCEVSDIPPIQDEVEDLQVAHMVSLIRDGFPFEINTWRGGVKASDAKKYKGGYGPDRLGPDGSDPAQT